MEGVEVGVVKKPALIGCYGPEGVGKTTFGSEAPKPIFIPSEEGSNNLNVARFPLLDSYQTLLKRLDQLIKDKHDYQSAVLDTLDGMEKFVFAETCRRDEKNKPSHVDEVGGGFQKGFDRAVEVWREVQEKCTDLRAKRGMNIIVLAHASIYKVNAPNQPLPYDRYGLKIHPKSAAIWREYLDCLLFVDYDILVKRENHRDKKGKAFGDGQRKMWTQRGATFDAKNRYSLPSEMPFELGYSWATFEQARNASQPDSMSAVMEEITYLTSNQLAHKKESIDQAVVKANGDLNLLIKIRNHARTLADAV